MKVKELLEKLQEAVNAGNGDLTVCFDTEARTFNCHYVDVDEAGVTGTLEDLGDPQLILFGLYTRYH